MAVASVVMAAMLTLSGSLGGNLLGSSLLGSGVDVLNLGLAKDTTARALSAFPVPSIGNFTRFSSYMPE